MTALILCFFICKMGRIRFPVSWRNLLCGCRYLYSSEHSDNDKSSLICVKECFINVCSLLPLGPQCSLHPRPSTHMQNQSLLRILPWTISCYVCYSLFFSVFPSPSPKVPSGWARPSLDGGVEKCTAMGDFIL